MHLSTVTVTVTFSSNLPITIPFGAGVLLPSAEASSGPNAHFI